MRSMSNSSPRGVLSFPSAARASDASATQEDKDVANAHYVRIHELCRDTTLALQELDHGIANVLLDTLEKLDLDAWTLAHIWDERFSVVRNVISGEIDGLTTATMIEMLEKLCE
jgi:hypothetical protein